jgi:hypothetical protein
MAGDAFSLTRGGPFFSLIGQRKSVRWALPLILWGPIALAAGIHWLSGAGADPLWQDWTVHVRLLVMLPLLFSAEALLESKTRLCTIELTQDDGPNALRIRAYLGAAQRLARSRVVEAIFAGCALMLAVTLVITGRSGLIDAAPGSRLSPIALWYALVALPVMQFVTVRWAWRWIMWSVVLVRMSRLELATNALHPDHAAGLKVLSTPVDAFAMFASANACLLAAAWTEQIKAGQTLASFGPSVVSVVILMLLVGVGPLLAFSPQLYRARSRDIFGYHGVATDLVRSFREVWMVRKRTDLKPVLLERNDWSALADLGTSFSVAEATNLYAFGRATLTRVVGAVAAPMSMLWLLSVPFSEVANKLLKLTLGGR